MLTIPLYTVPAHPDAWHQVRAPGGYEWWHFDAEDPRHNRHLVATLHHGLAFHPRYLRRYFRYRRFPTHIKPPLPQRYPCVHFALYESGGVRWRFMTQFPPDQFAASIDRPVVNIGPNRMTWENGTLQLHLQGTPRRHGWRGRNAADAQPLRAKLTFAPRHTHEPPQIPVLSRALTGAEHRWIVANPLCDVTGSIQIGADEFTFTGHGYHDHRYGTGPLGPGVRRLFRGRVLLDTSAYTFHVAQAMDPAHPDEMHLVEATNEEFQPIPIERTSIDWSRQSRRFLEYPGTVAIDELLQLHNPRMLEASPFSMRLQYDALCRGRSGTALCELIYPHRLRLPLLGRVIERSIDRADSMPP